jgi:hypothetical protein
MGYTQSCGGDPEKWEEEEVKKRWEFPIQWI